VSDPGVNNDSASRDGEAATGHWRRLPRWKRAALIVAFACVAVGGAFMLYDFFTPDTPGTTPQRRPSVAKQDDSDAARWGNEEGDANPVPKRGLAPSDSSGSAWPQLPQLPGQTDPDASEGPTANSDRTDKERNTQTDASGDADADPGAGAASESSREALWPGALFRLGFSFFAGFCIGFAARTFLRISLVAIGLVLIVVMGLQYAGLLSVEWDAMARVFDNFVDWLRGNIAGFRGFITGALPYAASALGGLWMGWRK
jgi:uncharacterized membrane protein (Fun14 family)